MPPVRGGVEHNAGVREREADEIVPGLTVAPAVHIGQFVGGQPPQHVVNRLRRDFLCTVAGERPHRRAFILAAADKQDRVGGLRGGERGEYALLQEQAGALERKLISTDVLERFDRELAAHKKLVVLDERHHHAIRGGFRTAEVERIVGQSVIERRDNELFLVRGEHKIAVDETGILRVPVGPEIAVRDLG